MNQQDYYILWAVYVTAAIILLFACFFFTNFLWRWLKEPIGLMVAIILFSPTLIAPEQNQYAPSIAVLAMDFLMHMGDHVADIANELLYRIEIALAIYFIFAIFIRWPIEYGVGKWWRNRKAAKIKPSEPQQLELDEHEADGHLVDNTPHTLQATERI